MASDKKWLMHEKMTKLCKILAKLGVLWRFRRGGGKNSNFGKKRIFLFFNLAKRKIAVPVLAVFGRLKSVTRLKSLQKMTRLDSSRSTNDSDSTKVTRDSTRTRPLRLESRLEPLADNLIIFMKKYDLERA